MAISSSEKVRTDTLDRKRQDRETLHSAAGDPAEFRKDDLEFVKLPDEFSGASEWSGESEHRSGLLRSFGCVTIALALAAFIWSRAYLPAETSLPIQQGSVGTVETQPVPVLMETTSSEEMSSEDAGKETEPIETEAEAKAAEETVPAETNQSSDVAQQSSEGKVQPAVRETDGTQSPVNGTVETPPAQETIGETEPLEVETGEAQSMEEETDETEPVEEETDEAEPAEEETDGTEPTEEETGEVQSAEGETAGTQPAGGETAGTQPWGGAAGRPEGNSMAE